MLNKTILEYKTNIAEEIKFVKAHPYGIFEGVADFKKVVLDGLPTKGKIQANTPQNVNVDAASEKGQRAQEESSKRNQDFLINFLPDMTRQDRTGYDKNRPERM